jgi:hypothetical protein
MTYYVLQEKLLLWGKSLLSKFEVQKYFIGIVDMVLLLLVNFVMLFIWFSMVPS